MIKVGRSIIAIKTDKFLKHNFKRCLMLIGLGENDFLNVIDNATNIIINNLTEEIEQASLYVQAMSNAINRLPSNVEHPYKQIIEDYYFKERLIREIALKLGWSEIFIKKRKVIALDELGVRFIAEQNKLGISKDTIIDLTKNIELV